MGSQREIYVGDLTYALGDRRETLDEAEARGVLLSDPSALREAGFAHHHFCGRDQDAYALALAAVKRLGDRVAGADALLYATSLPCNGSLANDAKFRDSRDVKYVMDFPVSHLQAELGLDRAMVIGVNQLACAALLAAIRLAAMVLRAEPDLTKALVITADRFPDGAIYEQAYNLISDGAAGCIVSRAPSEFRIIDGHGITNGAMAIASDDQTIGSYFTYTHRMITELLGRRGMTIDDVHWIVPQNINVVTWQVLASLLRFDVERVLLPTIGDVGHMISGDNIVNLSQLLAAGRFRSGERILLPVAGYGLNWQCLLVEKT